MNAQSISISGVLTLDMHALNNEGAEGNTMMTRMVEIVDAAGNKHTVNAISGDMLKHIQNVHLAEEAMETGLPLCSGCRRLDPNRICADTDFTGHPEFSAATKDSAILAGAIQRCTADDVEGILITSEIGKKRSIARKSCIEFGWAVGIPDTVSTDSYFHAKYVPEGRGDGSGDSANLGQNIFHRPASSGQYAVVVGLDLFRVGRNDISLEPAIPEAEAARRKSVLIRSVVATFIKPTGAHRNTQNPHILDFRGVVAVSSCSLPAPAISALNSGFVGEVERTAAVLNQMQPGSVSVRQFDGLGAFAETMAGILGPAVARVHA